MTGPLQVAGHDDRHEVPNVQAVRRGVDAEVEGHGLALQRLVEIFLEGDLCDENRAPSSMSRIRCMSHSFLSILAAMVSPDGAALR